MSITGTRAIPVWLDCDPGHDDATAILLAGHTPGIRLLGVSTIGGNQTLPKVTQNALDVLDAVGLSHIDVVAGQPRPLMRPPMLCPEIHGDTGLDGPSGGRLLPRSPHKPLAGKAIHVMYDAIRAAYEEPQQDRQGQQQLQRGQGQAHGQWTAEAESPPATMEQCGVERREGDAAAGREAVDTRREGARDGSEAEAGGKGAAPPQRVSLVCTGALTNAALLLTVYPEVVPLVRVTIMGGCMGVGNTGPVMEFNIQTDPEAAKIVFESGVDLTMVPLEVTHTVLATPKVLSAIGGIAKTPGHPAADNTAADAAPAATSVTGALTSLALDATRAAAGPTAANVATAASAALLPAAASPFRHAIQQLLLFFADTYRRVFHFEHPPLHDPVAVAWVVRPDLFETRRMRVDVETLSPLSPGQTVCDVWGQSQRPPNLTVALRVDVEGFWRLLIDAVARADAVSPLNAAGVVTPTAADGVAVGPASFAGQLS